MTDSGPYEKRARDLKPDILIWTCGRWNNLSPNSGFSDRLKVDNVSIIWGFKNISILHVCVRSKRTVKLHRKQSRRFDVPNTGTRAVCSVCKGTADWRRKWDYLQRRTNVDISSDALWGDGQRGWLPAYICRMGPTSRHTWRWETALPLSMNVHIREWQQERP